MINRGTAEVTTDGDGWTVRAADGLPSAHYEHMVVVRDGDAEVLSDFGYIEDVITPPYEIDALKEPTTR
jgi:methionyl aminopeptidase